MVRRVLALLTFLFLPALALDRRLNTRPSRKCRSWHGGRDGRFLYVLGYGCFRQATERKPLGH